MTQTTQHPDPDRDQDQNLNLDHPANIQNKRNTDDSKNPPADVERRKTSDDVLKKTENNPESNVDYSEELMRQRDA